MFLFRVDNVCYTYQEGWVSLGISMPLEQTFLDYGIEDLTTIPVSAFEDLERPVEILNYTERNEGPSLNFLVDNTEIYWAVKVNDTLYTNINNNWVSIMEEDLFMNGMTKEEIESITDFSDIYEEGSISVIGAAKSNNSDTTWWIEKVDIKLPQTFRTGSSIISCPRFNTSDWESINSISIDQIDVNEMDIRYAFSFDDKSTWRVYDFTEESWKIISDISTDGMTKTEVESISNLHINSLIMDINIYILNDNTEGSPEVSQISISYLSIDGVLLSNTVTVPIPAQGFRNVLVEDTYNLRLAEGIAFDDVLTDFDLYTTPDRIKLRPFDIGSQIGGRISDIYAFEIVNGYENQSYDIILRASKGNVQAVGFGTYGKLQDADVENYKTIIELSENQSPFNPIYPLQFRLESDSKKTVFIRVTPHLVSSEIDTFQINLIARPV